MANSTVLIADMAVLVGIFLLGLLAKLFPRRTGNIHSNEHGSFVREPGRDQRSATPASTYHSPETSAGIGDRADSR
jgi:hypothetical protein